METLSPTPSPYITAPSSPIHLPDSSSDADIESSRFSLAFDRDELKPNSFDADDRDYQDITFEFCVDQFQSFSLPAEELFDGGKIRTIRPPAPEVQLGRERPDSPPPPGRSLPQSRRQIIWPSRRSYDFSCPLEARRGRRNESGKTMSFGGSKNSRLNRLINLLSFRRASSSERGSTTSSKASTSFGSTGSSSSGSVSGLGVRYFPGLALEPDDGCDGITRDEVKSCLTPCKQKLLSCFVKKL